MKEAFVWMWLPDEVEPVLAGRLEDASGQFQFNYSQDYLERDNAISLYEAELPLVPGVQLPLEGLSMPGCLQDGAPDAWGRRVIINQLCGHEDNKADINELSFMLGSGSDRIGALDFQCSATEYVPRLSGQVSLAQLLEATERVEQGLPLAPGLSQVLCHASSVGGARPKALIEDNKRKYIAKFSSRADYYNVVKAEFIAMRLAKLNGLDVAEVSLTEVAGKDVLLIERFDRIKQEHGWTRRHMLSALTLFGLDSMMARYTSYEKLAEIIRHNSTEPAQTCKELFGRLVFNILCGNTDDHARNHAAFQDGSMLTLTPAYDLCPQGRGGNEASQAMLISGNRNLSQLSLCLDAAHHFQLDKHQAQAIIESQIECIRANWQQVCDEAALPKVEHNFLLGRQFLNPSVFTADRQAHSQPSRNPDMSI